MRSFGVAPEDMKLYTLPGYIRGNVKRRLTELNGIGYLLVPVKLRGSKIFKGVKSWEDVDFDEVKRNLGELERISQISNVDLGDACLFGFDIDRIFFSRVNGIYGSFVDELINSYIESIGGESYCKTCDNSRIVRLEDSARVGDIFRSRISLYDEATVDNLWDNSKVNDYTLDGCGAKCFGDSTIYRPKKKEDFDLANKIRKMF